MTLLALGINHKTASVSLRERVAFAPERHQDALNSLMKLPDISGGVVISTCNRTELYLSLGDIAPQNDDTIDIDAVQSQITDWLCQFHDLKNSELHNSLYWHHGDAAVRHLMRVACGLDSLVLGEPQILGQVKKAFALSQEGAALSRELDKLFQKSFSVAKRVRTETEIGASAVSVAFAACTLARQIFESLSSLNVLLVGAGETIELVARHLNELGVNKMMIANRTRERAQLLAQEVTAQVITLTDIDSRLQEADIVISSTAAPLPIIGKGMVERALKARRHRPILFVDIAVPRDIEPEVGKLANAYLYTVDDLHGIIENNLAQRKAAAVQAEKIIEQEGQAFAQWLQGQGAVEMIRAYRQQGEAIRDALQQEALHGIELGESVDVVIQRMAYQLTNRLLHSPTKALQQAASNGDVKQLSALRQSFGLE